MNRNWMVLFVLAGLAVAQQEAQKKSPPPQEKKQAAPLFAGPLGIRSSKKTKESATLGFNGIDPSGKVDKQMLATTPAQKDQEIVKKMNESRPTPAELVAFVKEGGLNQK